MKKNLLLISLFLFFACLLQAQTGDKNISLVVTGVGADTEQATKQALRSAIEQTFGTFVSANTTVLNDEVVRDEIATISAGNIVSYDVISTSLDPTSKQVVVTVKAVVSINNLVKYAKSRGSSTEFSGSAFTMNMRMRKLNKRNEYEALVNLLAYVKSLKNSIFDYKLETEEPRLDEGDYEMISRIKVYGNDNFYTMVATIENTLRSISLTREEKEAWDRNNMPTSTLYFNRNLYYMRNSMTEYQETLLSIIESVQVASLSWRLKLDASTEVYLSPQVDIPLFNLSERIKLAKTPSTFTFNPTCYYSTDFFQWGLRDGDQVQFGIGPIWLDDDESFASYEIHNKFTEEELTSLQNLEVVPDEEFYVSHIHYDDIYGLPRMLGQYIRDPYSKYFVWENEFLTSSEEIFIERKEKQEKHVQIRFDMKNLQMKIEGEGTSRVFRMRGMTDWRKNEYNDAQFIVVCLDTEGQEVLVSFYNKYEDGLVRQHYIFITYANDTTQTLAEIFRYQD